MTNLCCPQTPRYVCEGVSSEFGERLPTLKVGSTILTAEEREESKLSTSIRPSVLYDCGHSVNSVILLPPCLPAMTDTIL